MKGNKVVPRKPGEPMGGPALGAALAFRRRERGLTKAELASRTGFGEKLLRLLEAGEREPSPQELTRFAAALECEPGRLRALAALLAAISRQPAGNSLAPEAASLTFWSTYGTDLRADAIEEARLDSLFHPEEAGAERRLAKDAWLRIAHLRTAALIRIVDLEPIHWRWGFVELLCQETVVAAPKDHGRARDLAGLALELASRVAGEPYFRNRLKGYTWAFVANALRVSGDLPDADSALEKARLLWKEPVASEPVFLGEGRLLEIEAALRRDQRRFPEALICLRSALVEARGGTLVELLISLGKLLIEMGRQEEAIPHLEEAVRRIDPGTETRRLAWTARFNLLVCLCALDRAAEGEAWLPDLRQMAAELGNGIDQIRLRWLEGQVHAALNRPAEGIAALEEARDGFAAREMHYDVALAGLELCVLLLQEGHTGAVKAQAPALAATFQRLGIERERLATLTLFCAAAQAERATVEQARAALDLLRKAEE